MSDLIERLRQLADNTGKMTWVGDMPMPASAVLHLSADRIAELEAENARLRDAVSDIKHQAETRITDGDEMGARAWRIALVDILAEARAALKEQER